MLLSETIMVKWNGSVRKHYEGKGYIWTKQGDEFECNIDDVMTTSTMLVDVKCDYCGTEFKKQYRKYLNGHEIIDKDCCSNKKCCAKKTKETNLITIGVVNHMQTEKSKQRASENNRENFEFVVKYCEGKNIVLLSSESDYKNDRSELKIICNNHKHIGIQKTNFANIKKNKHCCKYGGIEGTADGKRLDGGFVYGEFIKAGLIPKFKPEDYYGNSQPLPYTCPNHKDKGVQYREYSAIKVTNGCYYCSKERTFEALRLDKEFVFDCFREKDLTVLDDVYVNKETHIRFECNKHKGFEQSVSYSSLKNTEQPCKYCREESTLTNISRKFRNGLTWWKKASKKAFNNKCMLTGIKTHLEIHHQYQFDNILRDAINNLGLDIRNDYNGNEIIMIREEINKLHKEGLVGICIHKDLHILFHIIYGKKECGSEMVNEFIEDYFKGNYDDRLEDKLKSTNSKVTIEEAKKLASFYYAKIK